MKKGFINGKRGFFDIIYIIVTLFIVALTIIMANMFIHKFNEQALPVINKSSTVAAQIMVDVENKTAPQFDKIFFGVLIGGQLGVLLLAYKLRTSPAFYWLGVLFIMITIIPAVVLSNVYEEIETNSELAGYSNTYTVQSYVMDRLPLIIGAFGIITLIVTYAMGRSEYA